MILSNINFQTKLQTLFEDLGWNKYVTNNVSMKASVAPIHLKLFFFSIVFKGGSFLPQHCKIFFTPLDYTPESDCNFRENCIWCETDTSAEWNCFIRQRLFAIDFWSKFASIVGCVFEVWPQLEWKLSNNLSCMLLSGKLVAEFSNAGSDCSVTRVPNLTLTMYPFSISTDEHVPYFVAAVQ